MKCGGVALVVGRFFHCFNGGRTYRARYIAYAHTDYIHIGISRGVGLKSAGYFGEKVGRREPVEVIVNPYHCYPIICQSLYINL